MSADKLLTVLFNAGVAVSIIATASRHRGEMGLARIDPVIARDTYWVTASESVSARMSM